MNDKMREEFEGWCHGISYTLRRDADGRYQMGYGLELWSAWKASREALAVNLPPLPLPQACRATHYACRRAIERAGVRVEVRP